MEMKRPVSIEDGSEVIAGNDWLKMLVDFDTYLHTAAKLHGMLNVLFMMLEFQRSLVA